MTSRWYRAGKTSQLIREIKRYSSIGKAVMVINHKSDIRFGRNAIRTHDGSDMACEMTDTLMFWKGTDRYKLAEVIAIEEIQFFSAQDAKDFCIQAVEYDGKCIVAAGLQGSRHRDSWPTISALIPLADDIRHLRGLCSGCRDGTPGAFTRRITSEDGNSLIGDGNDYACLCRKHYLYTSTL